MAKDNSPESSKPSTLKNRNPKSVDPAAPNITKGANQPTKRSSSTKSSAGKKPTSARSSGAPRPTSPEPSGAARVSGSGTGKLSSAPSQGAVRQPAVKTGVAKSSSTGSTKASPGLKTAAPKPNSISAKDLPASRDNEAWKTSPTKNMDHLDPKPAAAKTASSAKPSVTGTGGTPKTTAPQPGGAAKPGAAGTPKFSSSPAQGALKQPFVRTVAAKIAAGSIVGVGALVGIALAAGAFKPTPDIGTRWHFNTTGANNCGEPAYDDWEVPVYQNGNTFTGNHRPEPVITNGVIQGKKITFEIIVYDEDESTGCGDYSVFNGIISGTTITGTMSGHDCAYFCVWDGNFTVTIIE